MVAYFNDSYTQLEEIRISPFDRGFLFADGVYDVIRYYPSHGFFRADDHLKRLTYGLDQLRIARVDTGLIQTVSDQLIERNGLKGGQAIVYIQVTRGAHSPRRHFFPPSSVRPTLFVSASLFQPHQDEIDHGAKVLLEEDIRWGRCDIKTIALLPNVLSRQRAVEKGWSETIWARNGSLTEGSHTNICVVKGGSVCTPLRSNEILSGITRKVVLELCERSGIAHEERRIKESEMWECDECFLVGTTTEVTPVVNVNERRIADGKPGRLTKRIQTLFYNLLK